MGPTKHLCILVSSSLFLYLALHLCATSAPKQQKSTILNAKLGEKQAQVYFKFLLGGGVQFVFKGHWQKAFILYQKQCIDKIPKSIFFLLDAVLVYWLMIMCNSGKHRKSWKPPFPLDLLIFIWWNAHVFPPCFFILLFFNIIEKLLGDIPSFLTGMAFPHP